LFLFAKLRKKLYCYPNKFKEYPKFCEAKQSLLSRGRDNAKPSNENKIRDSIPRV